MTGLVLAMVVLTCSAGVTPVANAAPMTLVPAPFTFEVADDAIRSRGLLPRTAAAPTRSIAHAGPSQPAQAPPSKRVSKTGKAIAIGLGAFGGFMLGARVGYTITAKPTDDTSGLKGVIIGAPIGAAVGAIVGYALTK